MKSIKKLNARKELNQLKFTQIEEKLPNYISQEYIKYSVNNNKIISLPLLNTNSSKEEYLKYFNNCWLLTESLFLSLKYEESFYTKPYHCLRHPMIFYYGHVGSFYVNKMLLAALIRNPVNKEFEKIFETGVDEMTWDVSTKENNINWPSLKAVKSYRKEVYNLVTDVINKSEELFAKKISEKNPLWSLLMSFEHERIHLETSSALIREMDIDYVRKPKVFAQLSHLQQANQFPVAKIDHPKNQLVSIKEQIVDIGKKDSTTYGWDNEYGLDKREVNNFFISKFLISNGEFFEFIRNDGYHNDQYWCKDGLDWRKLRNIYHPTFWVPNGPKGSNLFNLRSCFEIIDMRWNYPVIVNYYEAKAFCKYKSKLENKNYRLPFEAEHKALASFKIDPVKTCSIDNFNFNLQNFSENEVDSNQQSQNGLCDIHGNVWQWLEDNFHPLKGFKIHDYYKDFSTPCFDDKHKMITGSSFFSTGNLASIYSRYHFRPHFFQHCGFRIVRSDNDSFIYSNKNIEIEFETTNKKNGIKYIIFRENNELKVLEEKNFNLRESGKTDQL